MGAVIGIDHVQLAMPSGGEAAARTFYTGLLGITEKAKPPRLSARGGCWFEGAGVKLHLGVEADFRPARKAHPGLLIADLAGLSAALIAAGHTVTEDDEDLTHIYVDDPFGNRIELIDAP